MKNDLFMFLDFQQATALTCKFKSDWNLSFYSWLFKQSENIRYQLNGRFPCLVNKWANPNITQVPMKQNTEWFWAQPGES